MNDLLTASKVAHILNVHRHTVVAWARSGVLKAIVVPSANGSSKRNRYLIEQAEIDRIVNFEGVMLGNLLTVSEAADMLHVHANTIRLWAKQGVLKSIELPTLACDYRQFRFERAEIEKMSATMPPFLKETMDDLLSPPQAACILGIHPATIRNWAKRGAVTSIELPSASGVYRKLRIPRSEIDKVLLKGAWPYYDMSR